MNPNRPQTDSLHYDRKALIRNISFLGAFGGAIAGGLFAIVSIAVVNGGTYRDSTGYSFGFIVGACLGLLTGVVASAAFLLAWWGAARVRPIVARRLVAAAASGIAITLLMAFVWLPADPDKNWTLGEVSFNWMVLAGCVAAAAAYFWVGKPPISPSTETGPRTDGDVRSEEDG
jgi:hypothetical protein